MGRRSKRDKPDPLIRGFLATNVTALRDRKYGGPSVTARNRKLAEKADTTLSQIQRVLSMELGTSIDLIARLARALDVRPQDLLTPYFAIQPKTEAEAEALLEPYPRKTGRSTSGRRYVSAVKAAARMFLPVLWHLASSPNPITGA